MQSSLMQSLNLTLPIILAPMAGVSTPVLVAAVSNSGGLGSFAAGYLEATDIEKAIREIKRLTHKPFAVNLFIPEPHHATSEQIQLAEEKVAAACPELHTLIKLPPPPYAPSFAEQIAVVIEENVPVVSFTFGILPKEWIKEFHQRDVLLIGTATHLAEAKQLAASDIDMIVAQGSEAGGHRGTFLGSAEEALYDVLTLTETLSQQLTIPIISAGGLMNGNDISCALTKGAQAVQMGTAFLSCPESSINEQYRNLLLKATADCTTLTKAFSGKLARGIKNHFTERMRAFADSILDYPIQNALTMPMRKAAKEQGQANFMSLWAGQALYRSRGLSASKLMTVLKNEIEEAISKACM